MFVAEKVLLLLVISLTGELGRLPIHNISAVKVKKKRMQYS